MENIIEKLKRLEEIEPDAEYAERSRLLILATPVSPQKPFPLLKWRVVLVTLGLLLVLIFSNFPHYFKPTTPTVPNLNAKAIETEFQNLDINIQLAEVDYYQKLDEAISLALKEISRNGANHLR